MKLRPRYSLLTLLVLTALVAGGVKWWRGPHHVVEQWEGLEEEAEFTFTRDWEGNQIIQGARVLRTKTPEGKTIAAAVCYYRRGLQLNWHFCLYPTPDISDKYEIPAVYRAQKNPLTVAEQAECERLILLEKQNAALPVTAMSEYIGFCDDSLIWKLMHQALK